MNSSLFRCHLCGLETVREVPGFSTLRQVTSDCRPWKDGSRLGACETCGTVQKFTDDNWAAAATEIYRGYEIYNQSKGAEQPAFDPSTGKQDSRSQWILVKSSQSLDLPETGRLLEIGCGNGAFLRTFNFLYPAWTMVGTEHGVRHKPDIEAIPGVEAFYQTDGVPVSGEFDMIAMVHVLEHIPGPEGFLRDLRDKLAPGGRLLIQIPDFASNPFDLTIADHCSHFSQATIRRLLTRAGYRVERCETDWVPKELTVIAFPDAPATRAPEPQPDTGVFNATQDAVTWLATFAGSARQATSKGPVAVFGSSIAATWLFGELDGNVAFFVDEDEMRIGGTHLNLPIRPVEEISEDVCLALALAPAVAPGVVGRLPLSPAMILSPPEKTTRHVH